MRLRNIIRNRAVLVAVACALSYWPAALALPTQPWLEAVRVIQTTLATASLIALSRAIWESLANPEPDRVDALTFVVGLKEVSSAVTGAWLLLFRLAESGTRCPSGCGRPTWMLDTLWFGFVTGWMPALSSLLLIAVPGVLRQDKVTGEDVPPAMLIIVGCVAGLGLFATLVVLASRPDARDLVETLRPWIR